MAQRIEVPGMGIVEFPDGMTDDQIAAAILANMPQEPESRGFGGMAGDMLAGAVRGAGSIGATVLAPIDAAARRLGLSNDFIGRTDRRAMMDQALAGLGADTDSFSFGAGKLGTEIAGTMGAGGVLARGASMLPGAARAAPLIESIGSAGFKAGGLTGASALGTRAAGGAVTGGAAAGLVNPEDAGTGALIGGALPGVIQASGALGRGVAAPFKSGKKKAAETLSKGLEVGDRNAVAAQLLAGQELVDGSRPTVAQVLRTPQASALERIVSETPGGALLKERYIDQNAARLAALDRVSPVDPRGLASAREDFGIQAIRDVLSGDQSARAATKAAYNAVPQDDAALYLPDLATVRDEFFPAGAFGGRSAVDEAVRVADTIGMSQVQGVAPIKASSGQTVAQAVRKAGGINLGGGLRGEAASLRGELKNLVRPNGGKNLNDMAETMYEAGLIPEESVDALLDVLRAEARGQSKGGSERAWQAMAERAMGDAPEAGAVPQMVTLREFDALRKSIGNASRAAGKDPERATEALALGKMRDALDDRINEVVRGDGAFDENLPLAWAEQLTAAQKLKRDQVAKFRTGPQAQVFDRGSDGLPKIQGGELARLVWGQRPGIAQDLKQFNKVLGEKPELLKQFRSMVTTEGASTATNAGNLTGKFVRWVDNSLPGLKESFEPGQVKLLQRIAADIKRAEVAAAAGAARGSPSYQNATAAMSLGLLDSPFANALANRVPIVSDFAGPLLATLRESGKNAKAQELAGLLANPEAAAAALASIRGPSPFLAGAQRGLLLSAPVVGAQ